MKKHCVIFTSSYPYGAGEPFLESEILYVASQFERVILFATAADERKEAMRPVPDNVSVIPLRVGRNTDKLALAVGAFRRRLLGKQKGLSLRQRLYGKYCLGKALLISKRAKRALEKVPLVTDETVVYSYWLNYICTGAILFAQSHSAEGKHIPVLTRTHRHDLYWEEHPLSIIPLQEFNIHNAELVVPCSKQGSAYLKAKYPDAEEKIQEAYLGTAPANMEGLASLRSKTFLTIAGMRSVKRIPLFAEAFALFCKKNPDWHWISIGEDATPDGDVVREIIQKNRLEKNVQLLGQMANSDLHVFLDSHSIAYLVNTSASEGLPVSMMEAESVGVPCVGTDVGGVSEIILDGENGKLLPKEISPEQLASVLEELSCLDENEYQRLSANAFKHWQKCFNAEKQYKEWAEQLVRMA